MRKITKLTLIALFGVVLACAGGVKKANAVPSLGVGTAGTYYLETSGETFQAYQSYWGATAVYNGVDHGFGLGSSGSTLHVWSNINLTGVDVWLLAENSFSDNSLSFAGNAFVDTSPSGLGIDQSIASYNSIYWGVNLGNPTDNPGNWAMLPSNPFPNGQFWVYDGTLTYSGLTADDSGSHLFAIADVDGNGEITGVPGGGEKSPMTTGAVNVPVPEPTTILLLGLGLVGLVGGAVRRKFKKNNKQ